MLIKNKWRQTKRRKQFKATFKAPTSWVTSNNRTHISKEMVVKIQLLIPLY